MRVCNAAHRLTGARALCGKVFVLRSRVMNHHYHRQHHTTTGITTAAAVAALLPLPPPSKKLVESLGAGTKWGRAAAEGSLRHAGEERTDDGIYYTFVQRDCARAREEDAGKGW